MMQKTSVRIETTGSAGAAAGSAITTAPIIGKLSAIHIEYDAGVPALTADVIVSTAHSPAITILSVLNNATSQTYHVRAPICDGSGVPSATEHDKIPVVDQLAVTMMQSDPGKGATVTFFFES